MTNPVLDVLRRCSGLFLMMAATLIATAAPVRAATFVVTVDVDRGDSSVGNGTCETVTGGCSLRAAIEEANALPGVDTIVLPPGQMDMVTPIDVTDSIRMAGPGSNDRTVIDWGDKAAGFIVHDGVTMTVSNVVVQHTNGAFGSAFYVQGALVISTSTITANHASNTGGAVYLNAGVLTATDVDFVGNSAHMEAGAIYAINSAVTLSRVLVESNSADLCCGGGLAFDANLDVLKGIFTQLTNVTVADNKAPSGGGIYYRLAPLALDFVTITNNRATSGSGLGGGLYGDYLSSAPLTVGNTLIAHNTAGWFGPDCYVRGLAGGATRGHNLVENTSDCNLGLGSSDITGQDPVLGPLQFNAPAAAGIETDALSPGSPAIDAGTCTAGVSTDARGVSRPSGGSCDIGAYELEPGTTPLPFSFDDRSDVPLDAIVAAPAAVSPSGITNPTWVWITGGEFSFDQQRWWSQPLQVTSAQQIFVRQRSAKTPATATHTTLFIGGISATFTTTTVGPDTSFTVNTTADTVDAVPGDGVCADAGAACSLRAALTEASAFGLAFGTTPAVHLPAGVYGLTLPGDDGTGAIAVYAPGTTLIGDGAQTTVILGGHRDRLFEVLTGRSAGSSLEIHGVTLRDGAASDVAGAILNRGTLVLADAALTSNDAGVGGAIENFGSLSLTNVTLSGNRASHEPDGTAPSAGGGAIANEQNATATLSNVTISGNTAAGYGGAIRNAGGTLTLSDVTISGNTGIVGGIDNVSGHVSMGNSILAGNVVSPGTLDPAAGPDCAGEIGSTGANLVGNASTCTLTPASGDLTGTAAQPLGPGLGLLADNGGPTLTRALLRGSPALNAGTCVAAADQRGVTRPQGGACDIGAFELADTTPPVLHLPGPILVEATGSSTRVSFDVSAVDAAAGSRPVTCTPASGSGFDVTTTTVTCHATDLNGNTATGTFTVTVRDTTPPQVITPGSISAHATLATGAEVSFDTQVGAQDAVGVTSFWCDHSSGAIFPIGDTRVTCRAGDRAGNVGTGSFVVTVLDDRAPTTVTLTSSSNPSTFGQPVTLTAAVSPSAATGTVSFYDGGWLIGTAALSNGSASVTTALLASGARPLTAFYTSNAAYEAGRSAVVIETVTPNRSGGLVPGTTLAAGTAPEGLAISDFDEDGRSDLLVADTGDSDVRVLIDNSDGTFRTETGYWTGAIPGPRAVAAGDFNGDGHADFAAVDSRYVVPYLGNGHGGFVADYLYPVSASSGAITAVDVNQDGLADVVVGTAARNGTQVLLARNNGILRDPFGVTMPAGNHVPILADVNGDGHVDLVTDTPGGIVVALGRADGTFAPPSSSTDGSGTNAFGIASGDFNADGHVDLAITNSAANTVDVFIGAGDGTFQHAAAYPAGTAPGFVAAGDVDGDGHADLAVANTGSNDVTVLAGDGTGAFHPAATYPAGHAPAWIALADFNGDGRTDLAVTNSGDKTITLLVGTRPTYPLTVTALDATRVYGDSNPAFAGVVLGLQDGDAVSVSYASAADPASPVGTYDIVPAIADPNGVLANYDVTIVDGHLGVTPASLTVTADDETIDAGSPLPVLTAAYAGFVNGDTPAQLTAPVTLTTTATAASAPGTYPIVASGAAAANYGITFVDGTLTIRDTPPTVTVPADLVLEATSASGAAATFAATATDVADGTDSVSCTPASGSVFPLGATRVRCAATNAAGMTSSAAFEVTVQDTTAPALTLPANIVTAATSQAGAAVAFSTSAADVVDGPVAVTCAPVSGATFAVGATPVGCTAADAHGNQASGSFTVTVNAATAAQVLDTLTAAIDAAAPRLDEKVQKIERALDRDRLARSCEDVLKLVRSLDRQKRLTPEERAALLADAQWLAATIGCGA